MSDMAKTARAAMKAKAQRLGASRPLEKVDSSTFVPPELLNADVKTGLRPISRRAFKSGGKVAGECAPTHAGRKPRKAGGKTEATEYANAKVNRNVKDANEERPGIKHVGALKTGGRAKYATQGKVTVQGPQTRSAMDRLRDNLGFDSPDYDPRSGGSSDASSSQVPISAQDKAGLDALFRDAAKMRKSGGRAKKMGGGSNEVMSGAQEMMKRAQDTAGVPASTLDSVPASSRLSKAAGLKKGGAAHPDEAMDRALIKKMVKSSARTGKAWGGSKTPPITPQEKEEDARREQARGVKRLLGQTSRKHGGSAERTARKEGGGVFTGPGYPGKIPGVVPGGRAARATGGKTKGKTNINIVIAAGKQPGQDGPMPPMAPSARPGGIPIPVPPPQAPGAMGAGAPMPMPIPMPMPGGAPAGGPPMARKAGGRITKVASSYKDMEAGAAGGEGRLQKTDIAKKHKDAPTFKKGGKVYRSYKDMDAGAASGLGRLEKSEIQSRKG